MTLILGTRCKDGVVLGSDTKMLRGGEVTYANKIFEENNVLFAVEGLTGIRDDFLLLLNNEVRNRRGIDTLYEMKVIVEDIISVLAERYRCRIGQESPVGVLMCGLDRIRSGDAKLYYIHGVGYGEQTNFLCSGHGGTYATSIAKFLCNPKLSVTENAKLIAYVILWISENVDTTVGGDPKVAMLRDGQQKIEYLTKKSIRDMGKRAKSMQRNLRKVFKLEN